jgi:MFS family permease
VEGRRSNLPPDSLAWLVWGLGACLYLIAFYQRVAPAVITRELSRDFGLSAASLGNLSAFYFYGYVAVQIPTGLLADRCGPRKVLTIGAAVTAAGTLLFALAPGVAWANAGRLAIGAAGGVAFVSMLKLASHWMPARRFALVSGIALTTGVIGATLAGVPLRAAVDAFGWRSVMVASAVVTAAVALAIWVVARADPAERGYASHYPAHAQAHADGSIVDYLRAALSYRNTWLMLLVPGALSGIVLTFAGLWGVPFLVTVRHFSPSAAAATASAMLIAWSVSSIGYAHWSERIGRRKPLLVGGVVATLVLWSAMLLAPGLPDALLVAIVIAVGVATGVVMLSFAFAKESVPVSLAGTVSGITNMGMMLGGMVMQPLVGFVLDRNWRGALADGARLYDADAYRAGFSTMLAWAALALVLIAFMRESYCRAHR